MSIESLQEDLKALTNKAPKYSPLENYPEQLSGFVHNELLPFLSNQMDEMEAQDAAIYSLVNETEDVLHNENATILMACITGAETLIGELRTRVGNDARLLNMVSQWRTLAVQTKKVIEDIHMPDDEDDEEEERDETEGAAAEEDPK